MKEPLLYKITRPLINIFVKLFFRPKYIGIENIPSTGNIILCGNHTNNFDCILLIGSTKRPIHFLAKDSLLKGLKKIIFKNLGIIPVNRSIHDKKALNDAIIYLNDGKVIGIFPEGTINRSEDIILPFKIGAVKMAFETNSFLIPFTIKGEYKLFKNNLTIEFLPPYKINNTDLTEENKKLMNIISSNLEKRK